MLPFQRSHYIRHVCLSGVTLSYACLYSATLSEMHAGFIYSDTRVCKVFSIRQGIWSVANLSDMPTGKVPLSQVGKTCWLPSWTSSWICHILSDLWIASLGCYKNDICNSRISKIQHFAFKSQEFAGLREDFLIFVNKPASWRPSCPHSYFIFNLVTS